MRPRHRETGTATEPVVGPEPVEPAPSAPAAAIALDRVRKVFPGSAAPAVGDLSLRVPVARYRG